MRGAPHRLQAVRPSTRLAVAFLGGRTKQNKMETIQSPAETKPGFGTEDEAVRLISKAPKWQPAKKDAQAGTQVKQIIRFTVTKEKSAYVEVDSIMVK